MTASRVNWKTISEDDFNTVVEQLLLRERAKPGLEVRVIDGRGGDEGIDVGVYVKRTGQVIEVLQLKWFPEGFSGLFRKRHEQIKASFDTAMDGSNPPVWTLVIPSKGTLQERKYVTLLAHGRKTRTTFIGTADLNEMLIRNPGVNEWLLKDVAIDALNIVQRDSAVLAKPGDLGTEVQRLAAKVEARSPYWGVNWSMKDGVFTQELIPLREDSAEREPLGMKLEAVFGPRDEELRNEFEDFFKYGSYKPLKLPSHVIKAFVTSGPEWFASTSAGGELEIHPAAVPFESKRARIFTQDAAGKQLASLTGRTTAARSGSHAGALTVTAPGGLSIEWVFPKDSNGAGATHLEFDSAGQDVAAIKRVMRFTDSLKVADTLNLEVDGTTIVAQLTGPSSFTHDERFRALIGDLIFIESECDVAFEFPSEYPNVVDVIWIRVARRLLEGKSVAVPNTGGLDTRVAGPADEALEMLLTNGAAMAIKNDDWIINIFDEPVNVGVVLIYHGHVDVDDGLEKLKAIKTRPATEVSIHISPRSGTPFRIYSPDRFMTEHVGIEEWNIPQVREHPGLAALLAEIANSGKTGN